METMTAKRITMATVKSFVRKNLESKKLYVKAVSSFNGMTDGVEHYENPTFKPATSRDDNAENTLGIWGTWFVGRSRDYFDRFSDDSFTGIKVYNSCGSFVLATRK